MLNKHAHSQKIAKEDREWSTPNCCHCWWCCLPYFVVEKWIGFCMFSSLEGPKKNQKKAQKQAITK